MTKRVALLATLILTMVTLPGCPGSSSSALVGLWVFSVGINEFGFNLNENHTADSVNIGDGALSGTWTWEENGTEFIMRRIIPGAREIYAARVTNNNSMLGAAVIWEDSGNRLGNSFAWSAVKQ